MITEFKTREEYKKISYYLLFGTLAMLMYCNYVFYLNYYFVDNIWTKFLMKIHFPYTVEKLIFLKAIPLILLFSTYLQWQSHKAITKELKKKYNTYGFMFIGMFVVFSLFEIFYFNNLITLVVSVLLFGLAFYFLLETKKTEVQDLKNDRRNVVESQFDQARELIITDVSVNIEYEYSYLGSVETSYANIVNPFRGSLIGGTPGSGKTFAIIEEYFRQFISKGFAGAFYDYKYPTLTKKLYNYVNWYVDEDFVTGYEKDKAGKYILDTNGEKIPIIKKSYPVKPKFYVINLDDPAYSHRCNPISEHTLEVIADADDATKNLMLNINKTWIDKEGDFFTDSANVYTSMLMWYLKLMSKKYDYEVCSLPHLIALSTFPSTEIIFLILNSYNDLKPKMTPFSEALEKGALEQLAGQTASAGIALSKISSPELFYIFTGKDFDFNINDPLNPKIISVSNNPQRDDVYAAPLGLLLAKIIKSINVQQFYSIDNQTIKRKNLPSFLIVDEFPTIYLRSIDKLIGTARSNMVAVVLGFQTFAQIVDGYTKEVADKIIRVCGNRIGGQLFDEDAKLMSETLGKHKVLQRSYNYSQNDLSENNQVAMEEIAPAARISQLSQGEFAAVIADDFAYMEENKIMFGSVKPPMELKKHEEIIDLPIIRDFTPKNINELIEEFNKNNTSIISNITDFFCKTDLVKLVQIADLDNKSIILSILDIFDSQSKLYIKELSNIDEQLNNENITDVSRNELLKQKESFTFLMNKTNNGITFKNYDNFKNFYEILDLKLLMNKILFLNKENIKGDYYLHESDVKKYLKEAIKNGLVSKNKNSILKDYENNIYNDIYRIVALEIMDLNIITSFLNKKPKEAGMLKNLFSNIIKNETFSDDMIKSEYVKFINILDSL